MQAVRPSKSPASHKSIVGIIIQQILFFQIMQLLYVTIGQFCKNLMYFLREVIKIIQQTILSPEIRICQSDMRRPEPPGSQFHIHDAVKHLFRQLQRCICCLLIHYDNRILDRFFHIQIFKFFIIHILHSGHPGIRFILISFADFHFIFPDTPFGIDRAMGKIKYRRQRFVILQLLCPENFFSKPHFPVLRHITLAFDIPVKPYRFIPSIFHIHQQQRPGFFQIIMIFPELNFFLFHRPFT